MKKRTMEIKEVNKMKKDIEDKLRELTLEESNIIKGNKVIDKKLYTNDDRFIVDIDKLILPDEMINIRKHTRFTKFPKHSHNFLEFNYVYSGKLNQIIDERRITLKKGEIIFLNKSIVHEIEEAREEDIIINFLIRPEFFKYIFSLADRENIILDFLINTIYSNTEDGEYLYFKVSDEASVQDIMEKIIIELYEPNIMSKTSIKLLVGLLIVELMKNSNNIEIYSVDNYEKMLNLQVLKYIDEEYVSGNLYEIAERIKQPHYKISKLIKAYTGFTFKQLVQEKRMNKAVELLIKTDLPVVDIMRMVGYENITYFYKIFKEKYKMTPFDYKNKINS